MKLNKMDVEIQYIEQKSLIGVRSSMSLVDYKVADLWQVLHKKRLQIRDMVTPTLFSLTLYKPEYFLNFNPAMEFEKWAAVEVSNLDQVPEGLEVCTVPAGLYAVFTYKGVSTDNSIFEYIYTSWLPQSGYALDDRPHFEVLGEKYKNANPESEELICIPIK